ncbi:hypothetical protein FM106_04200 [Brachybacterium faecium]|nr:hypothetical protein FM106_04200 [Brachybacterium faecium]
MKLKFITRQFLNMNCNSSPLFPVFLHLIIKIMLFFYFNSCQIKKTTLINRL